MQFQLACTAVHFWQLVVMKKNVEIFEISSSILTSWEFQVRGFYYSRDLSPRVLLLRVPVTSKSDSGLFTSSSRKFNQNALQTGKPD